MRTTIVIADDHEVVLSGLESLLNADPDLAVVGRARDGLAVSKLVHSLQPDILILDLKLPLIGGLEIVRQVTRHSPQTQIIVFSIYANEPYVVEALRLGARAYVVKDAGNHALLAAIQEVREGRRYLSPPLSDRAIQLYEERMAESPDPYASLTEREREVLQLTAEGRPVQEIADRLFISPRTVETHRSNLMKKMGFRNQAELIRYAIHRGLSPSNPDICS